MLTGKESLRTILIGLLMGINVGPWIGYPSPDLQTQVNLSLIVLGAFLFLVPLEPQDCSKRKAARKY